MATLLIADDHPLFRAALRGAAVEAEAGTAVIEAGTLDDTLASLESRADIDLVLLDLHMPGNHGLAGLAAIRAQFPAVAVVLVSANEDPQVVRRALDHGAAATSPRAPGWTRCATPSAACSPARNGCRRRCAAPSRARNHPPATPTSPRAWPA